MKFFKLTAPQNESKKPLLDCVRKRIVEAAERTYTVSCIKLNHDAVDVACICRNLQNIESQKPVFDAFEAGERSGPENNKKAFSIADGDYIESGGFTIDQLELELSSLKDNDNKKKKDEDSSSSSKSDKMPALRETFLSIVTGQYWHMIDNGELPKKAFATISLLRSIDVAKDSVDVELRDLAGLRDVIDSSSSASENIFNTLDSYSPSWMTLWSEIFYKLEFARYENMYYVLRAYGLAHQASQRIFASALFGPGQIPNRAEELTVLLESARLVEQARDQLHFVSPKLKGIVKSKIIADAVLEAQREALHTFMTEGILEEAEAETIALELEEDERAVRAARKQQTQTVTKIATANTVLMKLGVESQRGRSGNSRANSRAGSHKDDDDDAQSLTGFSIRPKPPTGGNLTRKNSQNMLFAGDDDDEDNDGDNRTAQFSSFLSNVSKVNSSKTTLKSQDKPDNLPDVDKIEAFEALNQGPSPRADTETNSQTNDSIPMF